MHASAYAFAVAALGPAEVTGRTVIEAGSLNVNGSVRPHVEDLQPSLYIGTDMRAGPGVDMVCAAEALPGRLGDLQADTVISTEMLEHAEEWQGALDGMIRVLKPGGVLVLTTRGPGFPRHDHPGDFWRFPVPVMRKLLSAAHLQVRICVPDSDPASPGVFAVAVKPPHWRRPHGLREAWDKAGVQAV